MSKLKVVSIQHPDAVNLSIELAADGSISIDKVPAGDVNVTPVGSIVSEDVQAVLEELDTNKAALSGATFTGDVVLAGDPDADLKAATKQYVDNNSFDPTALLALKAEQNVYLWEMQASTLGSTKKFTGWQGEGFLTSQDEVALLTGLDVSRNADLGAGFLGFLGVSLSDWTSRTTPTTTTMRGVGHGGTLFVAVGDVSDGGTVITSPDGITWTDRPNPATNHLSGVAHNGSLFVVSGNGGRIITSPDGITWTSQTTPVTVTLYDVAHADGLFVAVGGDGVIITSPDGITWTLQTTPTTEALWRATFGDGLFVVSGNSGTIITSPDGVTWTLQTTPVTVTLTGMGHGDGLFVAVGGGGTVITSPDGITWTSQTTPITNHLWDVAHGDGLFVAGGGDITITSPDGITWTSQATSVSSVTGVGHGDGLFVAVGGGGIVITAEAEPGGADSGTLTLTAVTLPATADTVYLLDDATLDAGVTLTYEATLDGGTTWETVTPGEIVTLAHSGSTFAIRASMARAAGAADEGRVFWFIGYAN